MGRYWYLTIINENQTLMQLDLPNRGSLETINLEMF